MINKLSSCLKKNILYILLICTVSAVIIISIVFKDNKISLDEKQEYTDAYLKEFTENLNTDNIRKQRLNLNIGRLKHIRDSLDQNGVLFLTHGTSTPSSPENYYFSKDGIRNNSEFIHTLSVLTNSKESYYLKWSGNITHGERVSTAEIFIQKIKKILNDIGIRKNTDPKKIPVNLAGHSFGASVLMLAANALRKEGYNIQLLLSFNCPNGTYKMQYDDIIHINVYSSKDRIVQFFGNIYFIKDFFKFDFHGPAKVTFDNAVNICIDDLTDEKKIIFLKNEAHDKNLHNNIHHHISRSETVFNDIIMLIESENFKDNNEISGIPDIVKKWEGSYYFSSDEGSIQKIEITSDGGRIKIYNLTENSLICIIPYDGRTDYKNTYFPHFIPVFSGGYAEESFRITEHSLNYEIKGYFFLLNALSYGNSGIKIKKGINKSLDLKIYQKSKLDLFYKK